ncbi:MAG TPA: cytochrome P450 [Acidimicrobiales bacterium]|nr:cytochrome P450 [Acidimicrobiales bacterium]
MTATDTTVTAPGDDERMFQIVRRVLNLPSLVRRPLASSLRLVPVPTARLLAFMVSPEIRANPWSLYAKLRRKRPVMRIPPGIWLVARHDDAARLARDPRLGVDEHKSKWPPTQSLGPFSDVMGHSMLFIDPPDHDRLRRLVARSFTPKRVEELRPRVKELGARRIDALTPLGRADVLAELAYPLPVDVICEMLGVPEHDRDLFPGWARTLAARLDISPFRTPEIERAGDEAAAELSAYLDGLITDPSKRVAGGLIDALVASEESGDRLTHQEVISTCGLLLIAGYETTANLIGNGLLALLGSPAQLAALRAGDVTAESAVEELLRHDGPVQMTQRIALEDIEVGGQQIEKGDVVILLLSAANRDPAVFAEPDALRLDRDPNPHLAFSYGIHACLGASLARLEAAEVLRELVDRFPNLRLDGKPKFRNTFVLRGLESLPLAWD